jgi:hypothetical protein
MQSIWYRGMFGVLSARASEHLRQHLTEPRDIRGTNLYVGTNPSRRPSSSRGSTGMSEREGLAEHSARVLPCSARVLPCYCLFFATFRGSGSSTTMHVPLLDFNTVHDVQ